MWYQFYIREHAKKKKANHEDHMIRDLGLVGVQERPKGYWRNTFFKENASLNMNKWRKKLQRIDPYSGLPRHTEEVLRLETVAFMFSLHDHSQMCCLIKCVINLNPFYIFGAILSFI